MVTVVIHKVVVVLQAFINNEDSNSVLCGFTIQNGIGTYSQDCYYDVYGGGGIFGLNSSPIIKNNIIRDNIIDAIHIAYSLGQGSGIYFREGSPQILNNLIMNNVVDAYWGGQGGGIFLMRCLSAQTMIYGNLIIKNEATIQGAGICAHESWVEISKNKIRSNEETQGIYCQQEYYGYPVIISNNIILDNGLSGIVGYNISAQIRNNLVAFNPRGDGISLDTYISSVVENNTVVGNGFDEYFTFGDGIRVAGWVDVINNITVCNRRYGIFSYDPSPYMTLDYNNVWENLEGQYYNVDPGPHDISCDPYFQNPFKSDFTLSDSSCCIDAGDPYSHNIPWGGFCRDIGAFEYDQGFYYDGHSIILKPFRIELPIKRR